MRIGGGKGLPVLLVPRSDLTFERIRISGDIAKSRSALRLNLVETRGYRQPRIRIVRTHHNAADAVAWCWDEAQAYEKLKSRLIMPPSVPEPLLYPAIGNGARLIHCVEGFEGQIWSDGAPRTSRWWSSPPNRTEWLMFLRSAQQPIEPGAGETPVPVALPLGDGPTSRPHAIDRDPENLVRQFSPGRVAIAASLLLAALAGAFGAQYLVESAQSARLEERYRAIVTANQSMIGARQRALGLQAEAINAARRKPARDALGILSDFLSAAPFESATVDTVRFSDRAFEARLSPKQPIDTVEFIARLERIDGLTDVSAALDPRNGAITVRARTIDFTRGGGDDAG
ncbi:MAG: hypothetical protein U5J99_08210 [Parvularculaceae bacterium]|nr:hypothetical protein [Parvularculaceae bacterium]